MKKMTLLVVLVVAFMTMAASAFAISPAYITWAAGGGNTGTGGPHQGYALATEKCAVCHSVHAAAAVAGAGVFGANAVTDDTELLLRSSVANACTYCHITSNLAGLQIYNAVASNYTAGDQYGHNGSASAECADCHAVHGANTFDGYIGGKILKDGGRTVANSSGAVQTEAAATLNTKVTAGTVFTAGTVALPADAANGDLQVTAFCTRCHKTFSDASENSVTASGYFSDYSGNVTYGSMTYKNHPLKAVGGEADPFTAKGANATSTPAAYVNAETCRSCHAAGDTRVSTSYGGSGGVVAWSFPHWTNGNAAFLPAGTYAGDANIGIADDHNAATGKPAGSNVVSDGSIDGACLRCHVNAANTSGVNMTF